MSNSPDSAEKKIVIFASGNGSNAENIIRYFHAKGNVRVLAVFSNKRSAKVLERAHHLGVRAFCFDRYALYESEEVLDFLREMEPDLIVLAGFLWMLPENILKNFHNRVINIHPALLPKYGGQGMYGDKVHQAVLNQKELKTGISIHYVNERYDEGKLIFQATTPIKPEDTAASIAAKVHELEHEHFPKVIERMLQDEGNA